MYGRTRQFVKCGCFLVEQYKSVMGLHKTWLKHEPDETIMEQLGSGMCSPVLIADASDLKLKYNAVDCIKGQEHSVSNYKYREH